MPAFCRICQEKERTSNAYIACNNCGSLACEEHSDFFHMSKNAFCTECWPRAVQNSASNVADATNTMSKKADIELFASLAAQIEDDGQIKEILNQSRKGNLFVIERLMLRLAVIMSRADGTNMTETRSG